MTMILSRLAVHYYRPDFTEAQAASMIRDMVLEDLAEFSVRDLEQAVRDYRRDPKARFFPTSGQLRQLTIQASNRARDKGKTADGRKIEFGESRPLSWWYKARKSWARHWHEDQISEHERGPYERWKAARIAKGETAHFER